MGRFIEFYSFLISFYFSKIRNYFFLRTFFYKTSIKYKNIYHNNNGIKMNLKHLKKSIKENYEVLEELKNILLVILIIIDLAMIFVVSIGDVSLNTIVFTAYFDLFVCVCLFFNLLVIYKRSDKGPWEFIKTHIIDILSLLPLNFILFRYFTVVRLFKLVKLIPLFQVIRLQNLKIFNKGSLSYFVQ